MTKPPGASFEERYAKARADDLIEVNQLIFSHGAPLGSDRYFRIREIASAYEREAHKEKVKP